MFLSLCAGFSPRIRLNHISVSQQKCWVGHFTDPLPETHTKTQHNLPDGLQMHTLTAGVRFITMTFVACCLSRNPNKVCSRINAWLVSLTLNIALVLSSYLSLYWCTKAKDVFSKGQSFNASLETITYSAVATYICYCILILQDY